MSIGFPRPVMESNYINLFMNDRSPVEASLHKLGGLPIQDGKSHQQKRK